MPLPLLSLFHLKYSPTPTPKATFFSLAFPILIFPIANRRHIRHIFRSIIAGNLMLPSSKPFSSHSTKPLKSTESDRQNSFKSFLQSPLSLHSPRSWLLISFLSLQIILFLILRSISVSFTARHVAEQRITTTASDMQDTIKLTQYQPQQEHQRPQEQPRSDISVTISMHTEQCSSGRIFVYDLPKLFNLELLQNCHELSPWGSRCDMLINEGFGRTATDLNGVVPANLIPAWHWTDQFVSEIIFHSRLLNHKCRTLEPESATAFYIPFYAGLAVGKYLWSYSKAQERDYHCDMMLRWVRDQPYFNRSNGWDHFLTMGRISWDFRRSKDEEWGSGCIYMPGMRNVTRLLIERNPWDYFDVGIPYPTGFHPRSDSDILQWQDFARNRNRSTLFCFAGATRGKIKNDFRRQLLSHCKEESAYCKVVNCAGTRCSNGTSAILETFLDSDFCLQPRGDSFTRRSIFDCMVAGSIPVFFWKRSAYYQYQWFLPDEPGSYSIFIDRNAVKNGTTSIRSVLTSYSKEEVKKMRNKVIDYIPKFVYAKPLEGLENIKDAFDVAIDGILRRFKEQEEWGYKW
ncbi:xyloglucan galactosyltransferase XLT2-like [Mangifera indica]|uniref:xyloglucan galactosyltransferase XLT2-like n=1 Tax=Mangifera indica TaxID=29780 RepID=UPI001CFB7F52|nr:xyloglucan galactosyltransferase XLT2-like [Mangifera indica]XP_044504724.1 xyloglucan galactosyltransferase XLT2-like [Mangifera indica]XP_044504725.1 xyloglucan galactosyltransferase XLT2-like [Mangifera indica]